MLDLFDIAKPQGCDIQTFYGFRGASGSAQQYTWVKPRGVSHIYIMLIGGGGTGDSLSGGGSGSVTVWYGSAQNVPDNLSVRPGRSSQSSTIVYQSSTLLTAQASSYATGASAQAAGVFANSGFYQSVTGQSGGNGSDPGPASTTFLGAGQRAQQTLTGNYGYQTNNPVGDPAGFFQLQPIIVGVGSGMNPNGATMRGVAGAIGCGSGGNNGATQFPGGPGMILIASW